MTVVQC